MAKPSRPKPAPTIGIIMGSQSDWNTMKHAAEMLKELTISFEAKVVSAHRTPDRLYKYATTAAGRGLQVIIAGAGGAAHLPGMTASMTTLARDDAARARCIAAGKRRALELTWDEAARRTVAVYHEVLKK